jgi:predicted DNA-binding transcriptional regulator AlpA
MGYREQHYTADELKVLTYREWCALAGISFKTGKRLFANGDGPKTVQLSPNRVGIRMIDHARWLEQRERSAMPTPRRRKATVAA